MLICILRYHDERSKPVVKSFVYLSDDPCHDAWFVQHVVSLILGELPSKLGHMYKRVWKSTDGAPSHFKSRFSMYFLLAFAARHKNIQIWWDFCAPAHGKGSFNHSHNP